MNITRELVTIGTWFSQVDGQPIAVTTDIYDESAQKTLDTILKNTAKVKVGTSEMSVYDNALEFAAGSNVTLQLDQVNKKIIINATGGGGGDTIYWG